MRTETDLSPRRVLDVIQVQSPCPAPWELMAGDDKRRFCTQCNKFVHNLTEMPADEAEKLVCGSAGDLCVRFARDPETNRVLTLDYRPVPKPSRRRAIATIASILAAIGFTGVLGISKAIKKPVAPPPAPVQFLGGAMAPLPRTTPPATVRKNRPISAAKDE